MSGYEEIIGRNIVATPLLIHIGKSRFSYCHSPRVQPQRAGFTTNANRIRRSWTRCRNTLFLSVRQTFKFSAGVCSAYHKTTSRPRYTFHSRLEPYSAGHMMPHCLTLYVQRMGLAIVVRLKPQDGSRTPNISPQWHAPG